MHYGLLGHNNSEMLGQDSLHKHPSKHIPFAKFHLLESSSPSSYRYINIPGLLESIRTTILQQAASYNDALIAPLALHPATSDPMKRLPLQHILKNDTSRHERQVEAIRKQHP